MARAIGGDRPGRIVGVGDLEQDGVLYVSQPDGARHRKISAIRYDYAGDAVLALDVGRIFANHKVGAALQDRARRKYVICVATDPIAADILPVGIGIIEFNKIQYLAVLARRGLI